MFYKNYVAKVQACWLQTVEKEEEESRVVYGLVGAGVVWWSAQP